MFFASDNAGPVHPQIMDRVLRANDGFALPYGNDPIMDEVRAAVRQTFEAPDAAVYLVPTGTAANALALATYCQPWNTIFCAKTSHIQVDECNAPEFFAGGAKLILVGEAEKMSPDTLRAAIEMQDPTDVSMAQRGPVSITQVTERGTVHSLDELQALNAVAKDYGLPVHLDGARFSNAAVALGCSAAEMTWKAGVDVVSFGGTKNGCMGVEAVVFFDPSKAWEFELRRKRGAHLFSKHRYLSAQMAAYLEDDLWRDIAQLANDNAAYLAQGLTERGITFLHKVEANMLYPLIPRAVHRRLDTAGARYERHAGLEGDADALISARLVCDWSISREDIDRFLSHF
ncbi:threonine aldolase family protein [Sulfitobacter aestuariivivens]|uniref:Low specificity L-threonine aldolase n=1 Tax=Sulfitobacter aestuariivivens TaxID=2766981 RepID=A0A927D6Z2_9RHOB|nr:beta-eliminating lyase-related protein [Sulfitobacter aestuariivivens]MBD3664362.1 low specificity L-threonine aldolase [Sulfitobacter aestuariivivens]